ncbi:MAG TPA: hypothetical protein VF054_14415 [Micromonosporaceae bacterium]
MSDSYAPGWAPVNPAPPTGPQAPTLNPESALVRAAIDLVRQHQPADHGRCARCDLAAPCPPSVHARQVVLAAGLDPNNLPEPVVEETLEPVVEETRSPRPKRTSGKRNHRVRAESEQVALAS